MSASVLHWWNVLIVMWNVPVPVHQGHCVLVLWVFSQTSLWSHLTSALWCFPAASSHTHQHKYSECRCTLTNCSKSLWNDHNCKNHWLLHKPQNDFFFQLEILIPRIDILVLPLEHVGNARRPTLKICGTAGVTLPTGLAAIQSLWGVFLFVPSGCSPSKVFAFNVSCELWGQQVAELDWEMQRFLSQFIRLHVRLCWC